jgi:hypothetical protein
MSLTTVINLERTRGDTRPFTFSIDLNGADLDITGATFFMTVDPAPDPIVDTANLFQLTGVITGAAALGVVTFTPTANQMNQTPNTYFYDVQMTEVGGAITTIAKGKLTIVQDITK